MSTPEQRAAFVERLGAALTSAGLARLPSRIFAAVMVDEDGRMTAAEIGEALGVSPAAVSGAVRYLDGVGMVRRERERGSPDPTPPPAPGATSSSSTTRRGTTRCCRPTTSTAP
jgi:DNA-binding transcriptional regulator GbsR (MarR family)